MDLTIDYIRKIVFLSDLSWEIDQTKYNGPEVESVKELIPENINELMDEVLDKCIEYIKTLTKKDANIFCMSLPSGYLRMCVRNNINMMEDDK